MRILAKIDGTVNNTFDRAFWVTPPFDLFYGPDIEMAVSGKAKVDPLFDPTAWVDPLFDPTADISD